MKISTRGRYALRMMLDMVLSDSDKPVRVKEIAERQEISEKYMEQIMPTLSKNGLVEAVHGVGGGYRLTRPPRDYRVGEILRLTEGDLAPVACLSCDAPPCSRSTECRTLAMWSRFNEITNEYIDGITLADLLGEKTEQT